ncbi:protein O-linked-mannose beta-1,2-N-acetylglucosaminyltransferase 1-like [Penaeus monodon]|uniref:protein O-linked-mannose beta-1,2-N-acetylglucosaminyltransferase 1-like n=1 Tax=Penaeus monodon TaxID=6687 RepID=UPI0018A7D1CE|nr:protein O-linked-mannose beta-1,2-N-acetylglucosaminyltransferase 1-like [Penaeus monodon]
MYSTTSLPAHGIKTNPTRKNPRYLSYRKRDRHHYPASDSLHPASDSLHPTFDSPHPARHVPRQLNACKRSIMGNSPSVTCRQKWFLFAIFSAVIGLMVDQSGSTFPGVQGGTVEEFYHHWVSRNEPSLRGAQANDFYHERVRSSGYIPVEVLVDALTVSINVNGKEVVRQHNETMRIGIKYYTTAHRGVHLAVLHPHSGALMLYTFFRTSQPRATVGLVNTLKSIQPGRILVFAAPGDWRQYLDDETSDFLIKFLKGWWVGDVCYGEMFVAVLTVGGPLWAEGVTEIKNHTQSTSSPLWLAAEVPRGPKDSGCAWYRDPKMHSRVRFCETYEGYGALCDCRTLDPISPTAAPPLETKEQIPVVIVTARKQYKVLKQLRQLWSQAGGGTTPILLSVDGWQKEARDFAGVMGLPAVFHQNPASVGAKIRINEHIKFSIFHAFRSFPKADKIIVLEDDLILSPDFIKYFHQTAPLLDADDSIFCINAYNYNSFPPTAVDTSRLYREHTLPAYGWMVTRRWSMEVLPHWPTVHYDVDWDWYIREMEMRGRIIITPQVSRTKHDGNGGVHVGGFEQATYMDRRAFNTDPNAVVDISYLTHDAHEAFLEKEFATATVLVIDEHPCRKEYVPKHKVGSFVIYYYAEAEKDKHKAYFTLAWCFGGYERGKMEHYHMMHSLGYYGNNVYLIACPGSLYCKLSKEEYNGLVYFGSQQDTIITKEYLSPVLDNRTRMILHYRQPPVSPLEEFVLENYIDFIPNYKMVQIGEDGYEPNQ